MEPLLTGATGHGRIHLPRASRPVYYLDAGARVFSLRFLPDGTHLLSGVVSAGQVVSFDLWTIPDGGRVRLPLPELRLESWWYHAGYGHAVAVHPSGDWLFVAWDGRLFAFRTSDGESLPVPAGVTAHQVVLSPDGTRLLVADRSHDRPRLFALTEDEKGYRVVWEEPLPGQFGHVAGFLPDGERFVEIDAGPKGPRVRLRSFADAGELSATRYPANTANQPQLTQDGRYLGVIGYTSWYLFDTSDLGKPRRISSTRSSGDYRSFAFHPAGRTVAMIHGGPTLVKVHDLATLRLTRSYRWKLGPLGSVTFSPDGALAAAGSDGGRIVVWDFDE